MPRKSSAQVTSKAALGSATSLDGVGRIQVRPAQKSNITPPSTAVGSSGVSQLAQALPELAQAFAPILKERSEAADAAKLLEAEQQVELSIAGGSTLDDVKGKPAYWLKLYNGAFGNDQGNKFLQDVAVELAEKPNGDADTIVSGRLNMFLKGLANDEQRQNAAQVIGSRTPQMILSHGVNKVQEARALAVNLLTGSKLEQMMGYDSTSENFYGQIDATLQATLADLQPADGFDGPSFNRWRADALKTLALKFQDPKIFDVAFEKDPNGNSLMSTPEGRGLLQARTALENKLAVVDKTAKTMAMIALGREMDTDAELGVSLTPAQELAYVERGATKGMVDRHATTVLKVQAENELKGTHDSLIALGQASGNMTDPQYTSGLDRQGAVLNEDGVAPAEILRQRILTIFNNGRVDKRLQKQMISGLSALHSNPKGAATTMAVAAAMDAKNPGMFEKHLDEQTLSTYRLAVALNEAGIPPNTVSQNLSDSVQRLPEARALASSGRFRQAMVKSLDDNDLTGDSGRSNSDFIRSRVRERAIGFMASQYYNTEQAVALAAEQIAEETVEVEEGVFVNRAYVPDRGLDPRAMNYVKRVSVRSFLEQDPEWMERNPSNLTYDGLVLLPRAGGKWMVVDPVEMVTWIDDFDYETSVGQWRSKNPVVSTHATAAVERAHKKTIADLLVLEEAKDTGPESTAKLNAWRSDLKSTGANKIPFNEMFSGEPIVDLFGTGGS